MLQHLYLITSLTMLISDNPTYDSLKIGYVIESFITIGRLY